MSKPDKAKIETVLREIKRLAKRHGVDATRAAAGRFHKSIGDKKRLLKQKHALEQALAEIDARI